MCTFLRFIQVILCPSGHNLFLMTQIVPEHFQEIHNLRLIIHQGQHDDTECVLKLCMLVKLVQNNIGIGIPSQLNTNTHTFPVGVVIDCCNSVYFLVPYKFCHLLYQTGFIDHIRQLGDNDLALAVGECLYICNCPHFDFSASCAVSLLNPPCTEDHSSGWEIGSFYNRQDLLQLGFPVLLNDIVNDPYYSRNNLPQIMGWYIGCHTYCDT